MLEVPEHFEREGFAATASNHDAIRPSVGFRSRKKAMASVSLFFLMLSAKLSSNK